MEKVRFGFVGVGGMGCNHLKEFNSAVQNAEVTAVCDVKKEQADKVAAEYNVRAFYDYRELIDSGLVDAIFVGTPHYNHTPITVYAFEKGVHVITDKPIAVHKADAEKMLEAHRKRPDLKFGAMFQLRTDPLNRKIKQLIESGELGRIRRINWIVTTWFRTQAYYNSGGWRATWEGEGGGVLLNQCPHQLDLFQWYFGMPSKVRAFCTLGKYHNIEVEDDVTAYFEFPNGATGVFITSTGEYPGTNRLEITSDRGRLLFEDGKITFNRLEAPIDEYIMNSEQHCRGPQAWNIDIPVQSNGFSATMIFNSFVDSILNGTEPLADGDDGINSVELANAMLYSGLRNEVVDMPLDSAKFEDLLTELIKNSQNSKSGN